MLNGRLTQFVVLGMFACVNIANCLADVSEAKKKELRNFVLQDCGSCHGMSRKGGLGKPLLPENLKDRPLPWIEAVILNGVTGTAMPPWKKILTPEEVAVIAQMLKAGDF